MSKYLVTLIIFLPTVICFAKESITLTTSGGVSLGSYKAGYHYYLLNFIKQNDIKVIEIGGASAGGMNSLLSVDYLCNEKSVEKESSLYWKFWINTGINELFDKRKVTKRSVFHREAGNEVFKKLYSHFKKGYSKNCNITLSIPVTNLKSFNRYNDQRIYSPSIKNYFVIKIKGNGIGNPVELSNVIIDQSTNDQRLLPLGNNIEENFKLLQKVIYATSAFPIAFEPVEIPVCIVSQKLCNLKSARQEFFIDGGILDNAPLDLAIKSSQTLKNNAVKHLYINTSNYAFKTLSSAHSYDEINKDLGPLIFNHISNVFSIARANEEAKLLEGNLSILDSVQLGNTVLPTMSSPLYAFFGFYDQSFRVFDFNLGMHDAKIMLEKYYMSGKYSFLQLETSKMNICLDALREPKNKSLLEKCIKAKENPTTDSLLQIAILRAFNFCHKKDSYNEKRFDKLCEIHRDNKSPIFINKKTAPYNLKKNIEDIDLIFDSLDYYNFDFKDLNQKYGNLSSSRTKIHQATKEILNQLEEKQSDGGSAVLNMIDSEVLGYIDNISPDFSFYTNIGSAFEVGISKTFLGISKSFSIDASLYSEGFESYFSRDKDILISIPAIGPSYSPNFLDLGKIKFKFGMQYGRHYTNNPICENEDKVLEKNCEGEIYFFNTMVSIFDRINLKLALGYEEQFFKGNEPSQAYFLVGYNFF